MNEDQITSCAFSGHRVLPENFDLQLLDRVIYNLLLSGYNRFLCGMARGFDLCAAERLLSYRNRFSFRLVACIPCRTQSESYPESTLIRYRKILEESDETVVLSEEYYAGCMQQRNRYLVDHCDVLVSYLRRRSGGTFYTVNYAKKRGKKIIEL